MNGNTKPYRVTGDHNRMVYSHHSTVDAARRAARHLKRKWGWCHPGSEPHVEQRIDTAPGWRVVDIIED